jgi:hypothetical protein
MIMLTDNCWTNWYIELYEYFPCTNNSELHRREGEVIREIGTIKKIIAGRTRVEYREDNKEKIVEYGKEYREDNKEKISEKQKEWHEDYKEYTKEYKQGYH